MPVKKTGSTPRALGSFAITLAGLIVLVLAVNGGVLGGGRTGVLLLPVIGALLAIACVAEALPAPCFASVTRG